MRSATLGHWLRALALLVARCLPALPPQRLQRLLVPRLPRCAASLAARAAQPWWRWHQRWTIESVVRSPSPVLPLSPSLQLWSRAVHGRGCLCMYRFLCSFRRCSMYMYRFKGLFGVIIIRLISSVQLTVPIWTWSRCPSSSWWCRDPGPCARWVCVVLSFVLVGGLPPCGPHGFRFTPFDHFCTRNPVGYWSALHTCQPSDPIFKSYRILFCCTGTCTCQDPVENLSRENARIAHNTHSYSYMCTGHPNVLRF